MIGKRWLLKALLGLFLSVGLFGFVLGLPSPIYAKTTVSDQKEISVYITKTGKKYHQAWCRHLRQSRFEITKSEALQRGYTPCKVCRP